MAIASQDVSLRLRPFADPLRRGSIAAITGGPATGFMVSNADRTLLLAGGGSDTTDAASAL